MTRNPLTDGETVLAPLWGSMMNAHDNQGIVNGIVPSVGTGNWDVDTTSGTVVINSANTSVSADTTTLTDPASDADLDSGEFRVDLLTVNSAGTINVAEGAAAVEPITPDIPTDEAVICAVVVSGDASSLQSGDIRDYRTIITYHNKYDRADLAADGNFETGTFSVAGDTRTTQTVSLSGPYSWGVGSAGFDLGDLQPGANVEAAVVGYTTDGNGDITSMDVYAHNETDEGSSETVAWTFGGALA